jgi:very-short-patch-repair endonuclease
MTSSLEAQLATQIMLAGLPPPEVEYRFAPPRRWRFDFAWIDQKLAVEVEGGTWSRGRHTRGGGFAADCEKYNEAALLGWVVLRFTAEMVTSGEALGLIERALDV